MNIKNLLNKINLSVTTTLIALSVNHLNAIHLTAEFYPEKLIPEKYYVPNNGDFTLIRVKDWPEDSPVISVYETRLTDHKTREVCKAQSRRGTETASQGVFSLGYIPGERVKYTFKDIKNNLKEEITIVPNPLFVRSSLDKAKITAELNSIVPTDYTLEFTGFDKDEVLLFQSSSYDESIESKLSCNELIQMGFMPGVIDKRGGVSILNFKRSNGETLNLELPWGLEFIKYELYMDNGKIKSIIENEEFLKENPEIAEYLNSKRR